MVQYYKVFLDIWEINDDSFSDKTMDQPVERGDQESWDYAPEMKFRFSQPQQNRTWTVVAWQLSTLSPSHLQQNDWKSQINQSTGSLISERWQK